MMILKRRHHLRVKRQDMGLRQTGKLFDGALCHEGLGYQKLLYRDIISKGLCTACGACIGICPEQAFIMDGVVPVANKDCSGCGACFHVCPGKNIHIDRIETRIFGRCRQSSEKRLGIHQGCYEAYASQSTIRQNATSGGVITALLLYAFDNGLIDGAILTGIHSADPTRPTPIIACNREDVLQCQKSKYMLVPGGLLSVLSQAIVEKRLKRVAVVGSPCHIHAVRKIQLSPNPFLKKAFSEKLKFALGLHCAFNFFPEGTDSIIQALGIENNNIREIGWRDTTTTPFPGKFCATTKDGGKHCMDLLRAYFVLGGIYDHPRCRLCYDWANEVSDISSGDEVEKSGFHRPGAQRSHTLVRTDQGRALFDGAVNAGYINVTGISEEKVSHNFGFVIKKIGNIPRIQNALKLGLPLPEFGDSLLLS